VAQRLYGLADDADYEPTSKTQNTDGTSVVQTSEIDSSHGIDVKTPKRVEWDQTSEECKVCNVHFTLLKRKHHCRRSKSPYLPIPPEPFNGPFPFHTLPFESTDLKYMSLYTSLELNPHHRVYSGDAEARLSACVPSKD